MEVKGSEPQGRGQPRGWVRKKRGAKARADGQEPDKKRRERAIDREVHIHQERRAQIRRLCAEGGRTYLGRSASLSPESFMVRLATGRRATERGAEVSRGHSKSGRG